MTIDVTKEDCNPGYIFNAVRPIRMIFSGPSGCGKTNALLFALTRVIEPFDEIYIFSPSFYMQPKLWGHLYDVYEESQVIVRDSVDEDLMNEVIYLQQERTKSGIKREVLFIFDDTISDKNMRNISNTHAIEKTTCTGRHYNMSTIILLQKINGVSTTVRQQCGLVAFKTINSVELQSIYAYCGIGVPPQFKDILFLVWKEVSFNPFIYTQEPHAEYYSGFFTRLRINVTRDVSRAITYEASDASEVKAE